MTKLTDLCDIQYGYAFDSGAFSDDESYPQLVRIRDVKRGYSETYYNGEYPEEYVLSAGDLLIGMDGEFNIARWKVDGALLNQRVCKIIAKDNADEEFLRFALSKALKAIEDRTSFATVKHLSAKELNKLEIPVPPYEEQKKISEILHRLEKVIDIRQNELASLDELIKARFVELFGYHADNNMTLEECCSNITGGGTPSMQHPEFYGGNIPFIKSGDVKGTQVTEGALWLTEEALNRGKTKLIPKGSIVVVVRSAALLHKFSIAVSANDLVINQDLKALTPSKDFLPEFLMWSIKSQEQILLGKVQTMLTSHIRIEDLLGLKVHKASMGEQIAFVDFLRQVDKSKVAVQKCLEETQKLFDSLMQEYFG